MQAIFAIWVCWCAYLNAAGWALSALHQLNAAACAVVLLVGIVLTLAWLAKHPPALSPRIFSRRFRRPLPAIFLLTAALIFFGGIYYAPTNFDALTYRLPRMLNWLMAGKWLWISTIYDRMNYSGVGWEWLAQPFLALTHSDRGLFLINALGFLLLPGLLFSIFRQLGVARKVAWTWMWLLPLAYGYVTQADSVGNDLLGALFCLLSVHFGLRARRSGRVTDLWLAGLAAALLTGVKLSNLPLALPCLVAAWPALGQLRKHLVGSVVVAAIAIVISALPIMALNQIHTGGWNGDPHNEAKMQLNNPAAALLGNSVLIAEESLQPPLLPFSNEINQRLVQALPAWLKENFPRLQMTRFNEFPGEEGAGLDLAITLPLLIVTGVFVVCFRRANFLKPTAVLLPPVALAAWLAALAYMAKMGSEAAPRLMLPYYPLLVIPWLLLPAQGWLLRWRTWRFFLALTALSALPVVVLSVNRPLWPAETVTARLAESHPENKTLRRLATTYTTYAHRNDVLAPLRTALPDNAHEIGFIASDNDSDYSLWRPFGQRKVKDVRPQIGKFLQQPDVEWLVVKRSVWSEITSEPLETWAQEHHAQIVLTVPITELVSWGPENWSVVHIEKPVRTNTGGVP